MEKIAWPCCTATTRRVVKLPPSRMRQAAIHRAVCGHQCLADHLPAEHALPADLRAQAPEQILFEPLDVEDGEELVEGAAHDKAFRETRPRPLAVSLRIRNVALLCDA